VMFTRLSERCEFIEDSLADEVIGWGGGEPEDPIEAFSRLAVRLGLRVARVGLETSPYYLHPHHYVRLKDYLGAALVAEPVNLVATLRAIKSPREIALIRQSARIADLAMAACVGASAAGRTELEIAATVYQCLLVNGSSLPASAINLVTGERCAGCGTAIRAMSSLALPTSAIQRRLGGSSTSARPVRACANCTTWRVPHSRRASLKFATACRLSCRTRRRSG
jgi:Xaa-Pro aminopeptidase